MARPLLLPPPPLPEPLPLLLLVRLCSVAGSSRPSEEEDDVPEVPPNELPSAGELEASSAEDEEGEPPMPRPPMPGRPARLPGLLNSAAMSMACVAC